MAVRLGWWVGGRDAPGSHTYGVTDGKWSSTGHLGRSWTGGRDEMGWGKGWTIHDDGRGGRRAIVGGQGVWAKGARCDGGMGAERRRDGKRESRARGGQEPPSTSQNPNPRGRQNGPLVRSIEGWRKRGGVAHTSVCAGALAAGLMQVASHDPHRSPQHG